MRSGKDVTGPRHDDDSPSRELMACWPSDGRMQRMDEKNPTRHWFQFHLGTAVLIMFTMAVLIWSNVQPQVLVMHVKGSCVGDPALGYGWPMLTYVELMDRPLRPEELATVETLSSPYPIVWRSIIMNASIALCICGTTAFACEWLIRRRSSRKPPTSP